MNKFLYILTIILCIAPSLASASVILGTANMSVLSQGLVGYWPLDGATTNWASNTTSDVSGNGNTGTLVSMSTSTSGVVGKIGQALNFNGTASNISTPNKVVTTSDFSFSVWVKNGSTNQVIDTTILTNQNDTNNYGVVFAQRGAGNAYSIFYGNGSGTWVNIDQNRFALPLNTWTQVTFTKSGANTVIYINGVVWAAQTQGSSVVNFTNANNFRIGSGVTGANRFFKGSIDDIRTYNRALSAQEVALLYAAGQAHVADYNAGMIAYWPLNEGSGTVLNDKAGFSQRATLVGSPTWTTGKLSNGLQFTGSPQIASTTLAWPSSGSISEWVYPTSYADWVSPAGWKLLGTNNGFVLIDNGGGGSPGRWRAVFNPNVTTGPGEVDAIALQNDVLNTWTHLTMTWSKSGSTYTVSLYVNGVFQSTVTWTGTPGANGVGHFHFGNSGDFPDNYFLGKVDDVRVYNYALNANQAKALYQSGAPAVNIGHSNTSGTALNSGLVGYWTFDGSSINWRANTVADMSGQGNTGRFVGMSTSTSGVVGKIGQALKFNSSTAQEVSVGTAPASLAFAYNHPFSISLWAKPSATVGAGTFDRLVTIAASSGRFEYFMMANNTTFSINVGKNAIGDNSVAGATFTVGQWYHLVGVYDGSTLSLYSNGTKVGSTAYTFGAISSPDGIFSIGGAGATGNTFSGTLDDVRVYNRTLSAQEVQQLYSSGR